MQTTETNTRDRPPGVRRPATPARTAPSTDAMPAPNTALVALAGSVLCFAAIHIAILIAYAAIHRDMSVLNLFSILEAQRLWPAIASGAASPWWSLAFVFAVYGSVLALLARRSNIPDVPRARVVRTVPNGAVPNGVPMGPVVHPGAKPRVRVSGLAGALVLAGGLTLHMGALASIEAFVHDFPSVPDVIQARLPYVDFGVPGELLYFAFLITMVVVLTRTQARSVPAILVMLGLFYAVRGAFLFLLPIGAPPTAPPLEDRFVLWPFAGHAYFPGGHTGMMTVLSLSVDSRPWRRIFLATTVVFALGTVIARTHYGADALGGWLTACAVVMWGRGRLAVGGHAPAKLTPAARTILVPHRGVPGENRIRRA